MPSAQLNGVSLYYEVRGKGEPLLLIAGLGSDSSSWSGVISEFSRHFQVIVFDNRGSGRSDIGRGEYSVSKMAEDAMKLLDFLKIERAHVLGHSMGGYIAQELAINYPLRVGKLVLESTAPVSSKRNNLLFEDFYSQLKREGYSEAWFKRWTFWLFSQKAINERQFIKAFIKNAIGYPHLQKTAAFKKQAGAISSFDARKRLGGIKAKTLILEGKDDILITPQESAILFKRIHKSNFKLLDCMAHSIHIEDPKLFAGNVSEFIGRKK